ncbi:MAG: hypothetical protein NZ959_07705 [Armatimonadetes bacterium]|nr:hypothetical protein [Armatimonadota bacterium]MDW8122383.1 hypothetical protein [Armatimonadota bacterium]
MMVTIVGALLLSGVAVGQTDGVRVDTAFYRPDRGTAFDWFEDAKDIQNYYKEHDRSSGTAEVYLHNRTTRPLTVRRLIVDGRDTTIVEKGGPIVWWRLRPSPLPPKAFGELLIRLRDAPSKPLSLTLHFDDGTNLSLTVPIRPPSVRLEGITFDSNGHLHAFLELAGESKSGHEKVTEVWLDGEKVTQKSRILSPRFWQNICPVVIQPPRTLPYGSFHYLRIDTTVGTAAAVFRARDDFFPLGSYGYVTPKEYALNEVNLYVSFSALTKDQLDQLNLFGLKGVSSLTGDGQPREDNKNHRSLWAYYLMDEPDVHDYGVQELPHQKRVGAFAMELVRRDHLCYQQDPSTLTFLTVNLTYKPANWFCYGRIADVLNTDPYALHIGWSTRTVFEVAETARRACAPNPMTITYQAFWIEPVKEPSKARFPRMPFPEEVRIMMAYALAGGAKGLISYIHCTERYPDQIFWGATDYPDVWTAIGRFYKEMTLIAPVIVRSHPLDMAKSLTDGVFVRALIASDALLLVCINERGGSLPDWFVSRPVAPVSLEVLIPPWLKPQSVFEVRNGSFVPLKSRADGDRIVVTLPRLTTTSLILLTGNETLPESLIQRYQQIRSARAQVFWEALQAQERERAYQANLLRKIPVLLQPFAVSSEAIGCYGIERKTMWNPAKETWNAWEWYDPEGKEAHAVRWTFSATKTGAYGAYACAIFFGHQLLLRLEDQEGRPVHQQFVTSDKEGIVLWRFPIEQPGTYRLVLTPKDGRSGAARVAKFIFVVPEEFVFVDNDD